MKNNFMFTSESVTEGHPDKMCDIISDSIVDHFLQQDPHSRITAECAVAKGVLFVAARFASSAHPSVVEVARSAVHQIGYHASEFNAQECAVLTNLTQLPHEQYHAFDEQDLDDNAIEQMVVLNQCNSFGYACSHTPALLPLPIWLAHRLARRLTAARLEKQLNYLSPDGTTQVCVEFRNRRPVRIHSVSVIASHLPDVCLDHAQLQHDIIEHVIKPVFLQETVQLDERTRFFVNPTGMLVVGGPSHHSGLTGRKNAIDTYGEFSRHSGSALSGKDPMRIDRVGNYMARYIAKNIVAASLAEECEVHLGYTIGQARPVSMQIETFGTNTISEDEIVSRLNGNFDCRPGAILKLFNLRHLPSIHHGGFYRKLAAYGHVGRMDIGLPWEKVDQAPGLRDQVF